jgi:bifunctional non-homologous end joining protein LigD
MPHYHPQLARLVARAPLGDEWLHEMKYDGYRIGCRIQRGKVTLISRNGKDWSDALPEIAEAALELGVRDALLDGEAAILMPDGRTSFQELQNAFSGASRKGLVYFAFDLLYAAGESFLRRRLEARKAELLRLVGRPSTRSRIRYSDHVIGNGGRMFEEACRLGLEGIVSKRRDAPYTPGRGDTWVKTKCVLRQELVIAGFTDPEGSRQGIGALLVGVYEPDGRLVFAGKVGTGFSTSAAIDLRRRLERIEQTDCPFTPRPAGWLGKHAHWAAPRLVAEVAFTEWTADGKIRHPSFQGLRADKKPTEVRRERPEALPPNRVLPPKGGSHGGRKKRAVWLPPSGGSATDAVHVAGVRISHPERVMYPDAGLTKLDIARYYERIEKWVVPHLEGRPLTLVRCPQGQAGDCFYMKHSKVWAPDAVRRVTIQEKTKLGEYLVVDSLPALVALVQMDVLEVHTWNSRIDSVERPDRIVIDIDPGTRVEWKSVVSAARLVREMLHTVDLESFVKTTGGAGLHVVVPLAPRAEWAECLAFARALAEAIERHDPAVYTTAFAKAGRENKMLIDYLRNNRTNTSVAAFSTRARAGAPVSVPLRWDELTTALDPSSWTVRTIERRLSRLKTDPWAGYWTSRQRLSPRAAQALVAI